MKGDRSFKIRNASHCGYVSVILVDNPGEYEVEEDSVSKKNHVYANKWRTWVSLYSDYSYAANGVYDQHDISISGIDRHMHEYYAPIKIEN